MYDNKITKWPNKVAAYLPVVIQHITNLMKTKIYDRITTTGKVLPAISVASPQLRIRAVAWLDGASAWRHGQKSWENSSKRLEWFPKMSLHSCQNQGLSQKQISFQHTADAEGISLFFSSCIVQLISSKFIPSSAKTLGYLRAIDFRWACKSQKYTIVLRQLFTTVSKIMFP